MIYFDVAEIVNGIYDALDAMVAEYSKSMYQIQMENLCDFEKQLSEIRRASLQAGLIDQMSCLFRSDH